MTTITIPKNLIREKELIVIPRKKYEEFINLEKLLKNKKGELKEEELLRLSREAKNLKKDNKLPILHSLRDFR